MFLDIQMFLFTFFYASVSHFVIVLYLTEKHQSVFDICIVPSTYYLIYKVWAGRKFLATICFTFNH